MSERPFSPGEPIARQAAVLAADLKATDIVVLDLRGVTDTTDYLVIASGTSDTHVRAIADHIEAGLKASGVSTSLTEGLTQGRWAVLDYLDCMVHVFHPTLRQFYQLERLWGDAKLVPLNADSPRFERSRGAGSASRATR
jgi:ribosome-associated protein